MQSPSGSFFVFQTLFGLFKGLLKDLELLLLLVSGREEAAPACGAGRASAAALPFFDSRVFTELSFLRFLQKMYSQFSFTQIDFLCDFLRRFVGDARVLSSVRRLRTELAQKSQIARLVSLGEAHKWTALRKPQSALAPISLFCAEPSAKAARRLHAGLLYAEAFFSGLSARLEHSGLFHLLRTGEAAWIESLVQCFCHLALLQTLLETRLTLGAPVASYVQLVQSDLRRLQEDFLSKLLSQGKALLLRFSRLLKRVFQASNFAFLARLFAKVQTTAERLKARAQFSKKAGPEDLLSLLGLGPLDCAAEFLAQVNAAGNLLRAGFELTMRPAPAEDSDAPRRLGFVRAFHGFLSVFVARNVGNAEHRSDFARVLTLLEHRHSQTPDSPFLDSVRSVREFLEASSTPAELGSLVALQQLLALFSVSKPERVRAAAKLFNHSLLLEKDFFESFLDADSGRKSRLADYEVLLDLRKSSRRVEGLPDARVFSEADVGQIRDLAAISLNADIEMSVRSQAVRQVADVFLNDLDAPCARLQSALCAIFEDVCCFLLREVGSGRVAEEFLAESEQTWMEQVLQLLLMFLASQRALGALGAVFGQSVAKAKGGTLTLSPRLPGRPPARVPL